MADPRVRLHIDVTFPNDPHVGECNRCHRKTWDAETIGTEDRMPQPDGGPCGGMFEEVR